MVEFWNSRQKCFFPFALVLSTEQDKNVNKVLSGGSAIGFVNAVY